MESHGIRLMSVPEELQSKRDRKRESELQLRPKVDERCSFTALGPKQNKGWTFG